MEILNAILQGILQGITEFLPVSSSGHLSIYHFIQSWAAGEVSGTSTSAFTVLLHVGTLAAVCICYRTRIGRLIVECGHMIRDIFQGNFSFREMSYNRRFVVMLVVALCPLLVFYPLLKLTGLDAAGDDNDLIVEGFCFLFTAVILFLAARAARRNSQNRYITWQQALLIGIFQGLALMPGISRSGSTIAIALILGLSKATSTEFSFIMGIPTILAACLADLAELAGAEGTAAPLQLGPAIVGILVSAIVGIFAIKLLNLILKKNKFQYFSYYCGILGVICICLTIIHHATAG